MCLELGGKTFWKSKYWASPIPSVHYYCNSLFHTKQEVENVALVTHCMWGTNSGPQDTKAEGWIFLFCFAETEPKYSFSMI